MPQKHCVLVQAHKPTLYILNLAKKNKNTNFYIHFDKKSNINLDDYHQTNIFLIEERVDVKWGGLSQIVATLSLLEKALENNDNAYFHLISGECIFLKSFNEIIMKNDTPEIYIDIRHSEKMRYRSGFSSLFADTNLQRSLFGKINTILNKILSLFMRKSAMLGYFGSQWFSANRKGIVKLLTHISNNELSFFKKKLCPDEHFFQIIIKKNKLDKFIINDNKRYLSFLEGQSNPQYLPYPELKKLSNSEYWIARKVEQKIALKFLEEKNNEH